MQAWIRVIWRFFYFAFSTIIHIAGFLFFVLIGKSKQVAGARLRRRWLSHVPAEMGLMMQVEGEPHKGTCLFVANHIGYTDPFLILIKVEANVVAKAEILRWPLIGLAGYLVGTIFVKRDNKNSRTQTANAIKEALESGTSILVFPEGTTSAGPGTLPFRPRSFEAAQMAGVPVQPIAILYESPRVAYIGDHTFIPHFFQLFRLKKIQCRVSFGPLLYGADTAHQSRVWIEERQEQEILKAV